MPGLYAPAFSWIHRIVLCAAALLVLHTEIGLAQSTDTESYKALGGLSTERMLADIRTLSSPSFNGRQAGTDDDLRSAQWIARAFAEAGLQLPLIHNAPLTIPLAGGTQNDSAGMMTSVIPALIIEPNPVLRIGTTAQAAASILGTDYLPVFDSPTADIQGPIIFVGYGLIDPGQGIDDYAGIDVANSVVLFLRGKPDYAQQPVSHTDKVRWARERGARAYLTATGPILHPYEARRGVTETPNAFYGQLPRDQAIPGAWISTALAERILAGPDGAAPDQLRTLQEQLNKTPATRSTHTGHSAELRWKTTQQDGLLANVAGMIPGTGPDTIIIGAHRDHFGRPAGLLFPGADDNASGTAVMLEVARTLVATGVRPQRTILFVSFSGEEKDLLGSRLYTSRPLVPLDSTKAMINIDHAGIGNGRLTVGVTGLDKSAAQQAGEAAGLSPQLDVFGFFPGGDHVPFKEAGVPTITVVSGGIHPHYHRPSDNAETVKPDVLQTVAQYVLTLAWQLATVPAP